MNKIRTTATRLGHILTKEERNTLRNDLHMTENKKRLKKSEKQKGLAYLIELEILLIKKKKLNIVLTMIKIILEEET